MLVNRPLSDISGVLVVDKPAGRSSASVDYAIRAKLAELLGVPKKRAPKVGHAGTLDPFATGVLVIGVGKATKDLGLLTHASKSYNATIRLGWATDTDDLTGVLLDGIASLAQLPSDPEILEALKGFEGHQQQMPCTYSAKKVDGIKAYEAARAASRVASREAEMEAGAGAAEATGARPAEVGLAHTSNPTHESGASELPDTKLPTTESLLRPVDIIIHHIQGHVVERGIENGAEYVDVKVSCDVSAGTFIRAIARDLGERLGCGGHLTQLERTRVGEFELADAVTLDDAMSDPTERLTRYPLGTTMTLGQFDGVHLGHQTLIERTVALAKDTGTRPVVLLIDRDKEPGTQLMPVTQRVKYIEGLGAYEVHVIPLSAVHELSAPEFLTQLQREFNLKQFVITREMRFGKGAPRIAEVASDTLKDLAPLAPLPADATAHGLPADASVPESQSVQFHEAPLLERAGSRVSSSRIRSLLQQGDVREAGRLLGRFEKVRGVVVHGFARGRELGFPTANVAFPTAAEDVLLPADAVYYGTLEVATGALKGQRFPAIISVGTNPTFAPGDGSNPRTLEVHVPGRDDLELYDEQVVVSFQAKMREIVKFAGVDKLVAQLTQDSNLALAAWTLEHDGIICAATDTVLGVMISAHAPHEMRQALYDLKRRPATKPLQLMVRDIEEAGKFGSLDCAALRPLRTPELGKEQESANEMSSILEDFRAGPTSLILRATADAHKLTANDPELKTIGMRIPAEPQLQQLLNLAGPVFATSANLSGQPEFQTVTEAEASFADAVDFYLPEDASRAKPAGTGSRVVALVDPDGVELAEPLILRAGS